jgi:hypothetical protein
MPTSGTRRVRGDESGVSLIALLIVLVSLGVMAATIVAVVNSEDSATRTKPGVAAADLRPPAQNTSLAEQAACKASAAAIESAALAYFAGHDATWPPDIAALTDASAPYLKSAPNPKWGLVYDSTTGHVDATACDKL